MSLETPAAPEPPLNPPVEAPKRRLVSDQVVDTVMHRVLAGTLVPGQELGSEVQLAGTFGVSRIPVRDALRRLQAIGLVEIRVGAGGGAYVSQPNPAQVAMALAVQVKLLGIGLPEIFSARRALQGMAVASFAQRATDAELDELDAMLDAIEQEADVGDSLRGFHAFHLRMVELTGDHFLHLLMRVVLQIFHELFMPSQRAERSEYVLRSCRVLMGFLRRRDVSAAQAHIVAHIADLEYRFEAGV